MLYYRGRLPHWIPDGAVIFLTWRLAGSAPPCRTNPQWLAEPRIARIVEDALQYGETARRFYSLYAWVIMSNHVHILIDPHAPLARITKSIKNFSAREANSILNRTGQPFWQMESYDHWVRDEAEFRRIRAYIEHNPVKAGLVNAPTEFLWSSAGVETSLDAARTSAYATSLEKKPDSALAIFSTGYRYLAPGSR